MISPFYVVKKKSNCLVYFPGQQGNLSQFQGWPIFKGWRCARRALPVTTFTAQCNKLCPTVHCAQRWRILQNVNKYTPQCKILCSALYKSVKSTCDLSNFLFENLRLSLLFPQRRESVKTHKINLPSSQQKEEGIVTWQVTVKWGEHL